MNKKIGILAWQGGVSEHLTVLHKLGVATQLIRNKDELVDCTHLIIPGGESTVIGRFLHSSGIADILKQRLDLKIWGTCAGAILLGLADSEWSLSLIDAKIRRNAFGRQIDSFTVNVNFIPLNKDIPAVFIRAPKIEQVANSVQILAKQQDEIIAGANQRIFITSFHPELSDDINVHSFFINNF